MEEGKGRRSAVGDRQSAIGTWSWFWQSVTGIALLVLAGLHMTAHHFMAKGGLRDYAGVVEYLSHPVIVFTELTFLVVVTAHALLGVRSILFDLGLSERAEHLVTRALWLIGLLTVAYGFWLTWTIGAAVR